MAAVQGHECPRPHRYRAFCGTSFPRAIPPSESSCLCRLRSSPYASRAGGRAFQSVTPYQGGCCAFPLHNGQKMKIISPFSHTDSPFPLRKRPGFGSNRATPPDIGRAAFPQARRARQQRGEPWDGRSATSVHLKERLLGRLVPWATGEYFLFLPAFQANGQNCRVSGRKKSLEVLRPPLIHIINCWMKPVHDRAVEY